MLPLEKKVVVTAIGVVEQTPNGNGYLTCQTSEGEVVLWLGPDAGPRVSWLLSQVLPLQATITCLKDRHSGRYWVSERAWPLFHLQPLQHASGQM